MVTFFLYGQFHSQMEKLTVTPQQSWIPPSLIPLLHLGYTVMKLFT